MKSCFHELTAGLKKSLSKAVNLHTNFRSHDGILKVANVVLAKLLDAFPKSIDKLSISTGLASGPKPGLIIPLTLEGVTSVSHILQLIAASPKLRILT